MALKPEQFSNCMVYPDGDERLIRYLKGETITVPDGAGDVRGWVLVCIKAGEGVYPLGFAKGTGSSLKNKYLAGWRWM